MIAIRKILACIDFSNYSLMTMEYAVDQAKAFQAQIIAFNVVNHRDITAIEKVSKLPEYVTVEGYFKKVKAKRHDLLRKMIKEHFFEDKSRMSIVIEEGLPSECILKTIEKEGVDLVVMANKGRGDVARVLFGSTAEKVFRHSPVSILGVRERARFRRK
ncbi:MAG: universal stress protein [Desulfopila sp.]|jgi:nucleotide-binding universal stress UspA family protein|nr:universal stress protein [Desulfopila sp.]